MVVSHIQWMDDAASTLNTCLVLRNSAPAAHSMDRKLLFKWDIENKLLTVIGVETPPTFVELAAKAGCVGHLHRHRAQAQPQRLRKPRTQSVRMEPVGTAISSFVVVHRLEIVALALGIVEALYTTVLISWAGEC